MPSYNCRVPIISIRYNYAIHIGQRLKRLIFRQVTKPSIELPNNYLSFVFAQEGNEAIFIHAGLSKIKRIDGVLNSYYYLLDELRKKYKTIFAPGFTPSFRSSGIYHKNYSLPEVGVWSRLFLSDATARTNDAIHSILQIGDYDFSSCEHQNSFGKDSCFFQLIQDNILVANIGTNDFVCTFIHTIENINEVPYIERDFNDGVIYFNDKDFSPIVQTNYRRKMRYTWNRRKIVRELKANGILRDYSQNGLTLYFFKAGELFDFLSAKIRKNPWWLIS